VNRALKLRELEEKQSIEEEAVAMKTAIEAESKLLADKIEHVLNPTSETNSADRSSVQIRESATTSQMMMTMLRLQREPKENIASHAVTTTSLPELTAAITTARSDTSKIINTMEPMETNTEKEVFLLQQFVIYTLSAYRKFIALHLFRLSPKLDFYGYEPRIVSYLCAVLVPCYFVFVCLFVFLFGVSIGPQMTRVWLFMIFLSILQDILVMKPFLTWYRSVIVSGIIKDSVKHVYINLRKKTTSIILRSRAESHVHQKSFNTRIQHVSIYQTISTCKVGFFYRLSFLYHYDCCIFSDAIVQSSLPRCQGVSGAAHLSVVDFNRRHRHSLHSCEIGSGNIKICVAQIERVPHKFVVFGVRG